MSSRQTAVINGLLAENVGKNDLVRQADSRAQEAESRASDAEHRARMNEGAAKHTEILRDKIAQLQYELSQAVIAKSKLIDEKAELERKNAAFKQLLSRPMREIAELSGEFKATYEVQQQMLAEWILAQRAYKETATTLGIQLGKTAEEVQQLATQNANAVLENRTQHGNDSTSSPLLTEHAATILAIRKRNGKA
jgi:hypothetical protein